MAQTLTTWAAKSLTSGKITPVNGSTLSANVAAIANLDNREVIALSVLGKIYELAHISGTNYKANFAQLVTDATAFFGAWGLVEAPRMGNITARIQAILDWNAGYQADSTLGTGVSALVNTMGLLRETPESTLHLYYFFLLYQLAV